MFVVSFFVKVVLVIQGFFVIPYKFRTNVPFLWGEKSTLI